MGLILLPINTLGAMAFLTFVLAVIISLIVFNIFRGLINKFAHYAENASNGIYEEIDIEKNDISYNFKLAFNKVIEHLKDLRIKLKFWSEQLEENIKERTENLQHLVLELVQTEKLISVGTLTAGVMHEINNPIGVIIPRVEYLLEMSKEYGLPEEFTQNLVIIKKQSENIAKISKNLLDFSRPSRGEFIPTNVNNLVEDVLILFESQIKKKNIQVKKDLGVTLPLILADSNKLQQALLMILNNAKDAIDVCGEIKIQTWSKMPLSEYVEILISDNGIGINQENINKIFDPFFTTKAVGQGTGLGLSITYGIIKEHKGSIDVRSEERYGTTFVLSLPTLGYKGLPKRQWEYFTAQET